MRLIVVSMSAAVRTSETLYSMFKSLGRLELSSLTEWCPNVLVTSVLAFGCFTASQVSARTFGGYDCTDDCVSHAAGYLWAEEHEIENVDHCPENRSEAFYEGCLTYVDDPERGADFDDEGRAIAIPRRSSLLRRYA